MIKSLKRKLILLATAAMTILMALLVIIMNVINYSEVVKATDKIIDVVSQPNMQFMDFQPSHERPHHDIEKFIPRGMSPEVPYEARYFTAIVSSSGDIKEINISRIISVDTESIDEYIKKAISSSEDRDFIGEFRYSKQTDNGDCRIVFLDCGRRLESFYAFMGTSITVGCLGCLIVFLLFLLAADKIVHPIAESYEKQKRFITDAGHEIKTPLTIIGANLDLLESDYGESESIIDIRAQVKSLGKLTEDLVYLSKLEESDTKVEKVEFPVSTLIYETAEQFQAIARAQQKNYEINIEPDLVMFGSPDAIRQLVTIFLDNAMKYSPEDGVIELELSAQKKSIILSVLNTTNNNLKQDNLSSLFDRFYRTDESRNSETGGHGIGLSIAQAIVATHNGRIAVETPDNTSFKIKVKFPL